MAEDNIEKLAELDSTLERIGNELSSLDPSQLHDFIRKNRQNIGELRIVEDARSEIQNQVLDPVSDKLVSLIEENRRQYVTNRWLGVLGVGAAVIGLAVYAFDPLNRDAIGIETRYGIREIDTSVSKIDNRLDRLEQMFERVDERVRVAIIDRLDPIKREGFEQVEGELEILENRRLPILTHEDGELEFQPHRLHQNRIDDSGFVWMEGEFRLYVNGGLQSEDKVREIVSIERLDDRIPLTRPWNFTQGDIIVFYGIYRFQVLRIVSTGLHGRLQADSKDAVYLLPLTDSSDG